MDKYLYKTIKATCLFQEGTPYQDKSTYEDFNRKIQERTGRRDLFDLDDHPVEGFDNHFDYEAQRSDRFFIQRLHVIYLFVFVISKKSNFTLSRIIKLESSPDSFVPFLDMDFYHYCLYRFQNHLFSWQTGNTLDLDNESCFVFYSPETETYLYSFCDVDDNNYGTNTTSLRKDYKLPEPVVYGTIMPRGIHDDSKFPKGFRFDLLSDRISGSFNVDKGERDFNFFQENTLYTCDRVHNTFVNSYSFWLNFYKHYGYFNILDFKRMIKKNSREIHPLDDSSFDKVNQNPILQKLLYRNLSYPNGYLRYIAYSFFSKGDEIDQSKIVSTFDKSTKKHIPAISSFELRICLDDECEDKNLISAPYENPYALGDLWNLKLGTDMILYHPVLKEAALVDGWEKKIYVFKLD